jgi:hypothetical protein
VKRAAAIVLAGLAMVLMIVTGQIAALFDAVFPSDEEATS